MASKIPLEISADRARGLKRYNQIAGLFHAVQAVAILALANGFSLPIHVTYLQGPPIPGVEFEKVELLISRSQSQLRLSLF